MVDTFPSNTRRFDAGPTFWCVVAADPGNCIDKVDMTDLQVRCSINAIDINAIDAGGGGGI